MERLLLLFACVVLAAAPAKARTQQVQRCIGADGQAVYTDRRCDDLGAVSRLPPAAAGEGPRLFRGGCPRRLSQLVGEIGAAIQGQDINRLASVYDWSGVSDASAARLLDRLEGVVERPLVDIAPVYAGNDAPTLPAPPPEVPADAQEPTTTPSSGPAAWMPSWNSSEGAGAAPPTEAAPVQAPVAAAAPAPARSRPVALRVEQTLSGSATPVRTVFGLRRNYGCFWITL